MLSLLSRRLSKQGQIFKKSINNIPTRSVHIAPEEFTIVTRKFREFCQQKNFLEVHTQSRKSILAACEDPWTITEYDYEGENWPMPQTGQMWLEHDLLKNPHLPGLFCVSTSYRNEPDPVPGRHDKIFPMIEFELHGGIDVLRQFESEFLSFLGFDSYSGDKNVELTEHGYAQGNYRDICEQYNTDELDHDHEARLYKDFGPVFFLENFPEETSPFWNMSRYNNKNADAKKIDVILNGIETIGSAERSCDVEEMRHTFYTISDGAYCKRLFSGFGKERVERELEEFLQHKFFERSGGGIGVTRLIKAMKENNLLDGYNIFNKNDTFLL